MSHPVTDRLPEESLLAYLSRLTIEAEALPAAEEAFRLADVALDRAGSAATRLEELSALLDARTLPGPPVSAPPAPPEEAAPEPSLPIPEAEANEPEPAGPSVRERVLSYLADHPWTASSAIAAALGANKGTVAGQLSVAKAAGLLEYQDGLYALAGTAPLVWSPPITITPTEPVLGSSSYVSTPKILDHFSEGVELTAGEAEELIGCSQRDVRDLARSGLLTARKWEGRILYSRAPARERTA